MSTPHVNDEIKKYLSSYRECRAEVQRMYRKVAELEAQARATTKPLTGMPRGGAEEGKLLAVLVDTKAEYAERVLQARRKEREIEEFVDRLPTLESRVILRMRYLEGMPWELIVQELESIGVWVTDRQVYRLHGKALAEAREAYNKEDKT